jgi:hypothetical protein
MMGDPLISPCTMGFHTTSVLIEVVWCLGLKVWRITLLDTGSAQQRVCICYDSGDSDDDANNGDNDNMAIDDVDRHEWDNIEFDELNAEMVDWFGLDEDDVAPRGSALRPISKLVLGAVVLVVIEYVRMP